MGLMLSLRHTLVLVGLCLAASVLLQAQDPCSLFQPEPGCRPAKGGAMRISFGQAELPATPWVQVPNLRHGQAGSKQILFRPSQLAPTTPRKAAAPKDCRMLQLADPLVDSAMVHRTHGAVAHMRVVTVVPCPVVNRHR